MRLLFVLPEYPPDFGGGIATYYGALLPALARRGHTVDVLVGSGVAEGSADHETDGVRVRGLASGAIARQMPAFSRYAPLPEVQRFLAGARALWEQADGGAGYDAVEVVDWGLLFAPWVAEPRVPTAVHLHGSSGQIATYDTFPGMELAGQTHRLLEGALLRHAHALHANSRANGAFWRDTTGRDVDVFAPAVPATPAREAPRRAEGFVAARLQEWKGPQVLAEALRRLGADAPTVEWAGRVVGHPRTGEPYDAVLAREYPDVWGQRLVPFGQVPPAVVAEKQAGAAFVVVPSLWDVYNLTVAEAMQQGAVVVCSDGAGGVDLVDDGVNGFAFAAGDATALADAIVRAGALTPDARAAMSVAACETVARETHPDAVAAAVEARYTALAGRSVAPAPSWIRDAVAPGPTVSLDAFLGGLPLRDLLTHAAGRLRRRLPLPALRRA